mgnify:CR=1 FL=1
MCEGGIIGIMLRWPSKGVRRSDRDGIKDLELPISDAPLVPSLFFHCACLHGLAMGSSLAFFLSLVACALRARVPLSYRVRAKLARDERRWDRETTLADDALVVERERVSRKGLFTPLEMWNSCRPPIRRIKSL